MTQMVQCQQQDSELPMMMFVTTHRHCSSLREEDACSAASSNSQKAASCAGTNLPAKAAEAAARPRERSQGLFCKCELPTCFCRESHLLCPACTTTASRQPCPLPFLPTLFTLLASQCSAIQHQLESRCNSLYYSPVATEQITYSPQTTHPLLMNSVLPGSSHKQSCSFLRSQIISQMLVRCLTKATPQCRP